MQLIDKCICHNLKFSDILKISENFNITEISELQKHIIFGNKCKKCLPYIEITIKNKKINFQEIIGDN